METKLLFPLVLGILGLVISGSGYATKSRRWPGLIAGFDAARCSDVDGLTRWVGLGGMAIGGLCFAAAIMAFAMPDHRGVTSTVLAVGLLVGTFATAAGCGRFTRR